MNQHDISHIIYSSKNKQYDCALKIHTFGSGIVSFSLYFLLKRKS